MWAFRSQWFLAKMNGLKTKRIEKNQIRLGYTKGQLI